MKSSYQKSSVPVKKTLFSLLLLTGIVSLNPSHAALVNGTVLTINRGTCATIGTPGVPPAGRGSCFGMEVNAGTTIVTNISGYNGIVIGTTQSTLLPDGTATSHTGAPNGTEILGIDNAWAFFTNTGMHQTTSPIVEVAPGILDFSGWNVSWNGIPSINMGGGIQVDSCKQGTCTYNNGPARASITCTPSPCVDHSAYTLSYSAVVPQGDPSGFGGVKYTLRLEGTVIAPVPIPGAVWFFGSGLTALLGFMRNKGKRISFIAK